MIGIISDSHDNMGMLEKAVDFLNNNGVTLVIHAGDYNSPFVAEKLKKLSAEFTGVFGNTDGERDGLNQKFSETGASLKDFLELEHDGKKIAVYHGQDPLLLDTIIKSKKYNVVVTGHTHQPEVSTEGKTIVINPGELCGYLTGRSTLAVLDTEKMEAEIIEL